MNVMIDLEMWDNRPTGRISQVAACVFDETGFVQAEMCVNIDVKSYPEDKFTIDPETIQWMIEKRVPFYRENEIGFGVAVVRLQSFLLGSVGKKATYWGKGAGFDQRALEHIFKVSGFEPPWNFWQWMDVRTETRHLPKASAPNAHDAMADCKFQISRLLQVWNNKPAANP